MKKRELLFSIGKKDFIFQTFRAGGQHQNKTDSGVRLIHKDSGAVGESRSMRSQHQNKKLAFKRLMDSNKFKVWFKLKCCELCAEETIDQRVEKSMKLKNLLVETRDDNGKWRTYEY